MALRRVAPVIVLSSSTAGVVIDPGFVVGSHAVERDAIEPGAVFDDDGAVFGADQLVAIFKFFRGSSIVVFTPCIFFKDFPFYAGIC
jgi:hypothetical protein